MGRGCGVFIRLRVRYCEWLSAVSSRLSVVGLLDLGSLLGRTGEVRKPRLPWLVRSGLASNLPCQML